MNKLIKLFWLLPAVSFGQLTITNVPNEAAWPAGKVQINSTLNQIASNITTLSTSLGGDLYGVSTNAQIATGAVTSVEILDWTIATNDIGTNMVTTVNIADGTITSSDIANYGVTNVDIATNGINSANLQDRAIAAIDIGVDVITTNELATGSVGTAEIIDASIANIDVNASAAIAGSKLDMTNGTGRIIATGRAVTYAGNTTDIMFLSGTATNGQVVTFIVPFIGTPDILVAYSVGVGGTNAYAVGANPTSFMATGQAATPMVWFARGNR